MAVEHLSLDPSPARGGKLRNAWPVEEREVAEAAGEEPVLISALEHYSYCPRQCGLIHLEQVFDENLYTMRGRFVHESVDELSTARRAEVRVETAVPLWSRRLGLVGRADVVEFHGVTPYPVEYKVGRRRQWRHEAIQVCAQAICLEEMLGVAVPLGAIYYHGSRQRREVAFDAGLRRQVEETVAEVRLMLAEQRLPPAVNDKRCRHCSLIDSCLPQVVGEPARIRGFQGALFRVEGGGWRGEGEG